MERKEIDRILDSYLQGSASVTEEQRIEKWLDSIAEEPSSWTLMQPEDRKIFLNSLFSDITKAKKEESGKVRPMYPGQYNWKRFVAAAAVILVLALAGYFIYTGRQQKTEIAKGIVPKDIPAPGTTRAVITLADGRQVYLDSAGNGTLAVQNNVKVVRTADGRIAYQSEGEASQQGGNEGSLGGSEGISYNTLTNPRGSRVIDMQLSDGSHVWLNAGSSLKYPVAFVAKERKVEITGEAYFEVAHNASKPFKVALPGEVGEVEVLGTHFNINAYDDEDALKVTLLEGSVKLSVSPTKKIKSSAILKPGEQGQLQTTNYKLQTIHVEDMDEVMAWKNGRFSFNGSDLQIIMRQVARWYDVDIVYQDNINEKFFAEMPRDTRASDVLKALQLTGKVHFKIEGKKIIVTK
jgi:transmembrane sensor